MEETLALIEKIVGEHKSIMQGVRSLEQAASDAEAIVGLEKAKETFMPGRLEQEQGLKKLQASLEAIDQGLRAHFNREETGLMNVFEKHGNKELASALRSLLLEHEDLRNRLAHAKKHVAELMSGGLSRHLWEASAHDMRAHISHTRKLLEAHAEIEQELFHKLRTELTKA
jgi:iron-sulfur cluster repair protein YtfE (RIC family)